MPAWTVLAVAVPGELPSGFTQTAKEDDQGDRGLVQDAGSLHQSNTHLALDPEVVQCVPGDMSCMIATCERKTHVSVCDQTWLYKGMEMPQLAKNING